MKPKARLVPLALLVVLSGGPAAAQAPPAERGGPDDPDTFLVPEPWRERARTLVDPGPSGLPGGLRLAELELGRRLTVTYRGEAGEVVVYVAPAATRPADAAWTGERLAVGVVSSTVGEEARDRAVAGLAELLAGRETGWGWLRVPADREERREATDEARRLVEGARRAAWLGDAAGATKAVEAALALDARDLPALLAGARALHRAGEKAMATTLGARARNAAETALAGAASGTPEAARLRVALASAAALEDDPAGADGLAAAVTRRPGMACDALEVARDLALAGRPADAGDLAAKVAEADPACDAAPALRVDLARERGDGAAARALADAAIAARPASLHVWVARARAALVDGRHADALEDARVATERGGGRYGALAALAAVMAARRPPEELLERWDGAAMLRPDDPNAVAVGAASCLARERLDCAAERLGRVRAAAPEDADLRALEAFVLARGGRAGDARAAADDAWRRRGHGPTLLASEILIARAGGDAAAEARATAAYRGRTARDPGPLALPAEGAAEAPPAAPAPAASPAPAPEAPAAPSGPAWPWVAGGMILLGLALIVWSRRA